METALVIVAAIAYLGFRQWLQHHRRVMVHCERLAALEKGVELPPLEQEIRRGNWNVQRLILLCGLAWISLGLGASLVLSAMIRQGVREIPPGIEWIGAGLAALGISHLIVYWVGIRKDK